MAADGLRGEPEPEFDTRFSKNRSAGGHLGEIASPPPYRGPHLGLGRHCPPLALRKCPPRRGHERPGRSGLHREPCSIERR